MVSVPDVDEETEPRLVDLEGLTPLSETTGADPVGAYARLRRQYGPVAPVELEPGFPAWLVMDYQDVREVVSDETYFSRNGDNWALRGRLPATSGLLPWTTPRDNAFGHDGERRRRLRAPLDDGMAEVNESALVRRVRRACASLIDDFAGEGSADLMRDYIAWAPLLAFAGLFGLDEEPARQMAVAALTMVSTRPDAAQGLRDLHAMLAAHVALRRRQPAGDLTTSFVQHPNFDGDDALAVNALSVMIAGGYEMTAGLTSSTLLVMLARHDMASGLRTGSVEVDQTIDEVLWRDPPVYNLPVRFALQDVHIGGRLIRRGDAVVPSAFTAHTDPVVSGEDQPWQEIGNHAHLAFSAGPHACPASRVGRLVARTAVLVLLEVLPDVRLAVPVEEVSHVSGSMWSHYPVSLPVVFAPDR